jgi:hypothetical protein
MSKPASLLVSLTRCHSIGPSQRLRNYTRAQKYFSSTRTRPSHPIFEQRMLRFSPQTLTSSRRLHTSSESQASQPPKTHDRGPRSEETTQTDFGELNVFSKVPPPASSIDSCLDDGFELANGVRVEHAGVLLVGGEVFSWRPIAVGPEKSGQVPFLNAKGQWEVSHESLGLLNMVWPRPGMLNASPASLRKTNLFRSSHSWDRSFNCAAVTND